MRRRSLSARLRAAFLTLGLVAIGLTGWQAYRIADRALEDAAYARLTAIRETKKRQIETYFRFLVRTVETLAKGEPAIDALLGFEAAAGNPADARSVEALHGDTLRGYAGAFGFEDLFLVGGQPPRALFSLQGGSYDGGALPELVERALANPDEAALADFSLDPPEGAPAAFAAAAIREGGVVRGALAVRLSAREIDQVMTGGAAWRQEGLGDSGETYLVGADQLMRSDSRFYLEDPDGYFEQLREEGLQVEAIEHIRAAGSTVLAQPVRTDAVRRALQGEAKTSRVLDYRGKPVLSSFTPLDLPGLEWVLLAEIDAEEVFSPVRTMRNRLALLALAVSAAFLAVGYWFSRRTTRPLFALAGEIDQIRRKGLDSGVELASFQDADDEIARLAESFHELAGRLRATTVSRDYFDNLLRSMLNAVFVVVDSPRGPVIRSANQAASRLLGRDEDGLAGHPLGEILGGGSSRPEWLQRLREEGELPPIEKTLVGADGRRIPVLFTAALAPASGGQGSDVVCVAQDITALKHAEEELRVLARRLLSAQEQERSRLARELHDDITQRLGVLAIDAGKLERASAGDDARVQAASLKEQAIDLAEDVQRLSRSLHPAILEDLGLPAALRAECASLSKRLDIPVSLAAEDTPVWLQADARLALYRIAQECFHNIARHAGASEVNVELSVFDDRVCLTIEDDGRGFAPAEARGRGGLGLASMEERVQLVRGALRIESAPGRGVKVRVEIPVEDSPR